MEGSGILSSALADPETAWNKASAIAGKIILFMVAPPLVQSSIASIRIPRHRDLDAFTALIDG